MNKSLISIAFYNVENLFDSEDSPLKLDKEFTPNGKKKWGAYRYGLKINKLGNVISRIGENSCSIPPVIIGLAEIENSKVLEDLIHCDSMEHVSYDYVHFDSPDERGIDTALLFNKELFELKESRAIPIIIYDSKKNRDLTRDILYVKGNINNETFHIYVNHWPSKRSGTDETRLKRIQIAEILHKEIESLKEENPKIIIMGDFNDNPNDESIQKHLVNETFKNPSAELYNSGQGTSKFYGVWMLFDQIIISKNLFKKNSNQYNFKSTHIFNPEFLKNPRGKYKSEPFRTYTGKYYQGGYSDHFPIYILLEKENL